MGRNDDDLIFRIYLFLGLIGIGVAIAVIQWLIKAITYLIDSGNWIWVIVGIIAFFALVGLFGWSVDKIAYVTRKKYMKRCLPIKEKYPRAFEERLQKEAREPYSFFGSYYSGLMQFSASQLKTISKISESEWSQREQEIIEIEKKEEQERLLKEEEKRIKEEQERIEQERRKQKISQIVEFERKFPHAFYASINKSLFWTDCIARYSDNMFMPEERSISKIRSLFDKENEASDFKHMRDSLHWDEERIREMKMKRYLKEILEKDCDTYATGPSYLGWCPTTKRRRNSTCTLNDKQLTHALNFIRSTRVSDLMREEQRMLELLKEEDKLIAYYQKIVGINERDLYIDGFLEENHILNNKREYAVEHIKELDAYIKIQKDMGISPKCYLQKRDRWIGWNILHGKPYYFFFHHYSMKYNNLTSETWKLRQQIYDFKDDKSDALQYFKEILVSKLEQTFGLYELSKLTFVCEPDTANQNNYRVPWQVAFPEMICNELNMQTCLRRINVLERKTPKHQGGKTRAKLEIPDDYFVNRNVVLFDDIVTTGETMKDMIDLLESHGANVLCVISLARTYSDYQGREMRPHPWSGVL